ncbi:RNA EXONUCLEASE REXO1 / RECO3 FAMILY MEMBER-RELATED [Salix koriyanagi]|uniref:RNA exonuclease 4 n=2 Tax=Salix koriyanagi TaxID=2511006 RepID=A0A9Q0TFL1_9ROSI|nr:RNA EXONUCLEASE REXO1 / RECO3 FAMILY MEMBER-RELATED [Salix koriyanagi]
MDAEADPPARSRTERHKCFACYKQFKKKEHLVEHMKISYHTPHQPKCGVCQKHCKSYESLRNHLTGPLSRASCSRTFSAQGCDLCLKLYDSPSSLVKHREICPLSAPASLGTKILPFAGSVDEKHTTNDAKAIAFNCVMVGGGTDGSLDLCARVCLVDEDEDIIFHTYVQPQSTVTDYRYEITGLTEEHLRNSKSHKEVQDKILEILYNGESARRLMSESGKARLLVGHDLKHGLDCLRINYPGHLLRDTAKYRPLLKTNLVSHSLKYLTKTYLGYNIQTGEHDPYVDCVSVMRLYKRMRAQDHQVNGIGTPNSDSGFESQKAEELENMTPDELYQLSKSNYKCWCLDSKKAAGPVDF